jgi:hypothetical protein
MMPEEFSRIRDWVEPAHPGVIKLHQDLIAIYTRIREQYQARLDETFDRVARQIGFVVTTTVPADLEINADGQLAGVKFPESLAGTIFEKELSVALNPQPLPPRAEKWNVAAGTYHIYLIWYGALKLKLRTDWMEPAHVARGALAKRLGTAVRLRPEVMEPVHWFDPSAVLPIEEGVVIHAIDEVYPDLKLMDRIMALRQKVVRPEVLEPAHLRPEVREPAHLAPGPGAVKAPELASAVAARPEVREPAHFRDPQIAEKSVEVLKQIADVLRKAGF